MAIVKNAVYMKEVELPFCPGCGHSQILPQLDKAMAKLNLDPKKTVLVTDIGCVGLSDQYFNVNAFHGLHGRSITYACGLKMANPELTVIVLMGDGGLGIGGTHFINAARRNIDITVIVFNNFNFGMTGGEHSVTTPFGGKTATTYLGNIEYPLDACSLVQAVNGGFAARMTVFDKNLSDVIAEAISFKGFAVVDIWEYCTAYYVPRNELNKEKMLKLLETYGFKTGIIHKVERKEYIESYIETYVNQPLKSEKRVSLETEFGNNLTKKTGIIIAGAAGQKVKSSATVFGSSAILSGLYATQKDDYPITIMTGHSISEIILDKKEINYTGIDKPDYMLVIAPEGLAKVKKIIQKMDESANIFVDESLVSLLPETKAKIETYPFKKSANAIDRFSITILSLATFLARTNLFPVDALKKAVTLTQKKAIAEINLKAIDAGVKLVEEFVSVK
ncbi:thiamine pyrophosphate-dependent enzyme [Candidatus Chrysopegis kryptomonas]|uniref:2-oxoglutarate ferredoxin oxidoreductase subunit beta n=1 Tax=Candidatus Chryseopegocella kryptomonas TaxID=1633643 RepID=A0A0P1MWW5_9BACT|nr:thiamine pyrophosphate-dependent enzyme [Candidatus Chrysopegis kryptomonas]CUT00477.1 2-oxoglutarate ferredoxin oxidoreductase subunit beta [Candidatus Chrysopegis kryptomonas]